MLRCWCSEPSQGLDGKLKTSRERCWRLHGNGPRPRAAHAGLDFQNGASAIVEMGRQNSKRSPGSRVWIAGSQSVRASSAEARGSNVIAAGGMLG